VRKGGSEKKNVKCKTGNEKVREKKGKVERMKTEGGGQRAEKRES
jgi:hypothetical protein